MATVTLACKACGTSRDVEDKPYQGRPILEWWRQVAGERCTDCRQSGRTRLPDPEAPARGKVGRDHPDTSRKAAGLVAPRAGSQRAVLLDLAAEVGDVGMTAYEASVALDRSPNQTATRLQELREQGWMCYLLDGHGNRVERRTTPGNTGLVQVLTPEGRRAWLHEDEPELPARADGLAGEAEALAALRRAGLLEGSTVVSSGMCRRVERMAAR